MLDDPRHFAGVAENPNYIKLSVEAADWSGLGVDGPGLSKPCTAPAGRCDDCSWVSNLTDSTRGLGWHRVTSDEMLVDWVKVWNGPKPIEEELPPFEPKQLLRNYDFTTSVTAANNGWTRSVAGTGNIAQGTGANLQRFRAGTFAALGTAPEGTRLRQTVELEAGVLYELNVVARAGLDAGRRLITVQAGDAATLPVDIRSADPNSPTRAATIFSVEQSGPVAIDVLLGRHATGIFIPTSGTNS
jgi:hypothetical protein